MAAKHTAGPWFMKPADKWLTDKAEFVQWGHFNISAGTDDGMSPNYYYIGSVSNVNDSAENEANARLMAAAPTTAQMAMDFTLLVERYVRDDTGQPPVHEAELAEAMYALRAHIAQATGSAS